jgi:hypothetical protein
VSKDIRSLVGRSHLGKEELKLEGKCQRSVDLCRLISSDALCYVRGNEKINCPWF